LLDGLNGHLLPLVTLVSGIFAVKLRHHAFGQQRDNSPRAQFDGFLDDAFDDFPPGHCLQQRDGAGEGRREIFQRHGKRDGIA